MAFPFFGSIDIGLLYPLLLIPLGIVGATATFNFLAGFNGLEAGQGILLLSALSIVAFFTGTTWLALIGLCMVIALLAFLFYNFTPAKVFPGDVLTYSVGALIAIMAILGNFEKVAVFFFIPYIMEVILKSRGKLVKYSFGKPQKDGSLELLYPKIYGLTHLSILILKKIGIKPTEKKVVYLIWTFQLLVIIIGFIIFRTGIFL
jgi:UDP-N-acetylglucosamine--dolichyl-phosphate N-acetylglucosaminephosphotransferase